ncbi:MAG: hypothetical protein IH624_01565, partial [Phycisphaerae bacterium]|nr:hypothetical protein [Phycisphaerae bacterium]
MRGTAGRVGWFVLVALFWAAAAGYSQVRFYVSEAGNDSWSGAFAVPNAAGTDGPFATLQRAREAVRA